MARRSLPRPAWRGAGRCHSPSGRCISWPSEAKPSSGRSPGPGSHPPPPASRAPEPASGHAGRPQEQAAGSATRRVGRLPLSVRPASPAPNRTVAPGARQPWAPPVTGAAGEHGAGLGVRRSARAAPDGPRHTGHVAAASPAGPLPRCHAAAALCSHVGHSAAVAR